MESPDDVLHRLVAATDRLVHDAVALSDEDVRSPSLLPGWSRGHVLTHLARNAESGARLLEWARTGLPSYEYESFEARAAAIEAGACRPAGELLDDVRRTSEAFAAAAASLAPGDWDHLVRWTGGQETPASTVVSSRLTEVLVHHVDLDVDFGPDQWPEDFVTDMLTRVVASLNRRDVTPTASLRATDTDRAYVLGAGATAITGTEPQLLAWLLGRSAGSDLTGDGSLPTVPPIY